MAGRGPILLAPCPTWEEKFLRRSMLICKSVSSKQIMACLIRPSDLPFTDLINLRPAIVLDRRRRRRFFAIAHLIVISGRAAGRRSRAEYVLHIRTPSLQRCI